MKLRYKVNQAECFRAGINCEHSIQVEEVDPSTLTQEDRILIADRLEGIDVVRLGVITDLRGGRSRREVEPCYEDGRLVLIEAKLPGLEHLIEACRQNTEEIKEELAPD